jgi:hypothetical protein
MSLNVYWDKNTWTMWGCWVDIASQRTDDLDKKALEYCWSLDVWNIVDLWCWKWAISFKIAELNESLKIKSFDILDQEKVFEELRLVKWLINISFTQQNLSKVSKNDFPNNIDVIYSQRFIHYLRYETAIKLLSILSGKTKEWWKLFLSSWCIDSELVDWYNELNKNIQNRFWWLSSEMANKHWIHWELCLYSKDEFNELWIKAWFKKNEIWNSSFGTLKWIFQK